MDGHKRPAAYPKFLHASRKSQDDPPQFGVVHSDIGCNDGVVVRILMRNAAEAPSEIHLLDGCHRRHSGKLCPRQHHPATRLTVWRLVFGTRYRRDCENGARAQGKAKLGFSEL